MPKVPRTPTTARLEALSPDLHALPAGSLAWRINFRGGRHPTRWGDFRHVGPTDARFDHHLGRGATYQDRAVLYAAEDPITCFAEVFQRTRVHRALGDPALLGMLKNVAWTLGYALS